jgi:hypothetical protein
MNNILNVCKTDEYKEIFKKKKSNNYQQEMTAIASATVGASSGGRGRSSAPGGLPFFIEM